MKVLIYAGSEFITGDEIAAAVMRYSEALAEAQTAANVEIPVVGQTGTRTSATLLLGPASQIVAADAEVTDDLSDPGVVAQLDALTRALRPTAIIESHEPQSAWEEEF